MLAGLALGSTASAQTGIRVIASPTPEYKFGETLNFQISVQSSVPLTGATLFVRAQDEARTLVGEARLNTGADTRATYTLNLALHPLTPFANVEYWWEIRDSANTQLTTEPENFYYEDNRFPWQTAEREKVTAHWYEGDHAFGQAALDIAVSALTQANRRIHAPLPENVNVYIYANGPDVQAMLAPIGRAWAGGHADPALGVVIVAVTPGPEAESRLRNEIPHELTHLLVYQATSAHYAQVPSWLNEGLAVMNQEEPNPDAPALLDEARRSGTLLSLNNLCGPFPVDATQAELAYAESESVVRYISDQHGDTGLADLLAAYADGAGCSAGVERGLGFPLSELESRWLQTSLNANPTLLKLQALIPWIILAGLVLFSPAIFILMLGRRGTGG
jgi:hypothetical protein